MTIFELSIFGIRIAPTYYGLAYAIGFLWAYWWIYSRKKFTTSELDLLLYSIMAGIILGGRIGYVVFYNLSYYWQYPSKIFAIWEWGMSFHGGIIGVIIAILCYSKYVKKSLWVVADEVSVTVPLGICLWRIANYLNNELYGYPWYRWPFAMIHQNVPHFPSPLLESVLEGLLLWTILLVLQKRQLKAGILASLFLIGYSLARLVVEMFFRLPDPQVWHLWGGFSMGSWLSFIVLLTGIVIACYIQFYKIIQKQTKDAFLRNWQ